MTLPTPTKVRIGRWWFKNRSFSPIPLFLLMAFLSPNFIPTFPAFLSVISGILACEGLRLWAVGFAGSATRTRGENIPELVHAGPYRYVRNPLYVANIGMYTLVGFLFGFTYLTGFVFLYSCLQYTFIVAFEEERLALTFGQKYLQYCTHVPRWFVATSARVPSSGHQFDMMRAIRSERSTFYSMMLMGGLYGAKLYFWHS